ncbi:glutamate ABC transporter substrate-binding protein [Microbacterium stercoris]|uniref:Glutamate ABC transporter substrate-binding protein n=1 Tax=Microbacterium stercoris TaxID=2820289 RepID=A0A939QJN5_9MICO|nr:glutamate ABC transporter substrate-binding protein [Microbacterium stercoris]MBO3663380.1 glutamate ABC transporter substrate-binding protein [Microbacterium stercoris]
MFSIKRTSRVAAGLGLGLAALLALTACNSGSPTAPEGAEEGGDEKLWEVASDVELDSPTFERATEAGKIVIGVKADQPGLGYEDATTGDRTGFDVDIARWIAASLGFEEDAIEFKTVPSANREQEIINGGVDLYVGTYSMTDARDEVIDFAGPYLITGQGLLVRADDDSISGPDDLADKVTCSVTGSTPLQRIKEEYSGEVTERQTYSECVEQLLAGQVDAITTDEAILAGYVAQDPDNLKLAGEPFSEERYGVGLADGDTALQEHINTLFTDGGDVWQALFDTWLAPSGVKGEQPAVD